MEWLIALGMNVVTAILILIVSWIAGNYVKKFIRSFKKLDETLRTFLGGLAKYTILAVAIVTILTNFGVETASLIAILGAAGLAVGLALQGTLSNVASGVMLLILRPFSVGDYVEAGSIGGTAKSLGLFVTELSTADNVYISVPNSKIWNSEIKNYSRNRHRRQDIICGISYNDDINKAFKIVEKVLKDEKRLIRTEGKEPQIMVSSLGDSAVNITARVWSTTTDFWQLKWDLNKNIKEALDEGGITIPFPTRTLEMVGPMPTEEAGKTGTKKKSSSKKKAA